MAKTLSERWTSALAVDELAGWFKETAEERHAGTGRFAKMVARGKGVEFFTPDSGDDPFAAFEDQPAFAVGVTMPRGGGVSGQAELVTLHMYVADLGGRRAVEFTAPVASAMDHFNAGRTRTGRIGHSAGSGKKFIRHFEDMLQRRDSSARKEG
jgi:hypothetical protein